MQVLHPWVQQAHLSRDLDLPMYPQVVMNWLSPSLLQNLDSQYRLWNEDSEQVMEIEVLYSQDSLWTFGLYINFTTLNFMINLFQTRVLAVQLSSSTKDWLSMRRLVIFLSSGRAMVLELTQPILLMHSTVKSIMAPLEHVSDVVCVCMCVKGVSVCVWTLYIHWYSYISVLCEHACSTELVIIIWYV